MTILQSCPSPSKSCWENLLRSENGESVTADHIRQTADWHATRADHPEVPLMPSRILLQDFTGVPAVADIAAMRDAAKRLYGDPMRVNLVIPSELVIDHSVQVDYYGTPDAFDKNVAREYERNEERYQFLRWAHESIENFTVVPPGTGIVHQVNLEYLGRVVFSKSVDHHTTVFPDSLVGLDSHTTMINGIGVMGWGVGGIEAEAVMLGRPYYFSSPDVVGFKLTGALPKGSTATDLVLAVTQILREKGVVGKFVEFFGPGIAALHLEDRATIANMAPEYGATMGFFPVDAVTLDYLKFTGRSPDQIDLIETYLRAQGLFRTSDTPDPEYSEVITLDMAEVDPAIAGPSRPQDRILLSDAATKFSGNTKNAPEVGQTGSGAGVIVTMDDGKSFTLFNGAILIAAITSCTNTSNPYILIQAGLLAKKAVERGLKVAPWVKTSLAPGSQVVPAYLDKAGLTPALEALGFHLAAFGCTTCIGNSGPIADPIANAVLEHDLVTASVLSGNRNFSGRISPITQNNYLASPPLVVAYAIAGNMGVDLLKDPLGTDAHGSNIFLRDIWPTEEEVAAAVSANIAPDMFTTVYQDVLTGTEQWQTMNAPEGAMFEWEPDSTYIKAPPFLEDVTAELAPVSDIKNARVLGLFGDSITTDHISPAGAIPEESPAAEYLKSQGILPEDFNSFGSRRGNHEVMMRGTFGNIRLDNKLVPEKTGGYTRYFPEETALSIYDAAMKYQAAETPLLVIAGKYYGTGSSRDWAAKGTLLLGVKAVLAESFERIHRSNLVCMGVLPLEFAPDDTWQKLGLDGTETYDVIGIEKDLVPGKEISVRAKKADGKVVEFTVIARLDGQVELTYFQNGGILPYVLRHL